jgi:arylformamidase
MRHDPGLAASPPVRYKLKVAGDSMTSGDGSFARDELDREYSPSSLADDMPAALASWAWDSEQARATTTWSELRYGPGTAELLDLFPAARAGAPLLVFVHGGYWTELSKRESAFLAPGLVSAGVSYAALDYPLAPHSSLDGIVDACEQAVDFLLGHGPGSHRLRGPRKGSPGQAGGRV